MIAENAPILAERRARLAAVQAEEAAARATLEATPAPGPGLPRVELWHKALFVGGAEFLMFSVPFAALRLRRRQIRGAIVAPPPADERAAYTAVVATPPTEAAKINDGGWASRRAKYGPSGRKPSRRAHLKVVTA